MHTLWRRLLVWLVEITFGLPRTTHKPKLLAPPSSPIPHLSIEEALQDTETRLEAIVFLIDNPEYRGASLDEHELGQELMFLTRESQDMRSYLNASRS